MTKNKKNKNKRTKQIKNIILALTLVTLFLFSANFLLKPVEAQAPFAKYHQMLPENPDKEITPLVIFQMKTRNKTAKQYVEMWDVINCESRWKPNAKNGVSTARGLGQFIFKTWDNYCYGDVYDPTRNLDCFIKLYPKNKEWWECSKLLGYTT